MNNTAFAGSQLVCIFTLAMASSLSAATPKSQRVAIDPALEAQIGDSFEVDRFTVQRLGIPAAAPALAGDRMDLAVDLAGVGRTLELHPYSLRSPDFQVLVDDGSGELRTAPAPPVMTWRGEVHADANGTGGIVAGSFVDGRFMATLVMDDGEQWAIQQLAEEVNGVAADLYVVYNARDSRAGDWTCGEDSPVVPGPLAPDGGIAGGGPKDPPRECEIAFDADREYYQLNGASVNATTSDIESILNSVEAIYLSQTNITYTLTQVIVRTAEPDPYSTSVPGNLLNQFRDRWNNFHYYVTRDVAHLMTGRDLQGSVIGIAWLSVACTSPTTAYGLSQSRYTTNFTQRVALTAHELGHNWSANHCNGDLDCGIMCSSLGGCTGNLTVFGTTPKNAIINWRNTHLCMNTIQLPPNDTCVTARQISFGSHEYTNVNAVSNGTQENTTCQFTGSQTISGDVWFHLTQTCNGVMSVSLCGANFDTRLAMYDGCPGGSNQAIACNDNSCGTASQLTFWADGGDYYIRVGGQPGSFGTGFLNVSCINGPGNNECTTATAIFSGANAFNTTVSTTSSPQETTACFSPSTQISNDLWFKFGVPFSGIATLSLCGTSFDARMALYASCPSAPGETVACNDNFCGNAPQLIVPVNMGTIYRVRVGGTNGATGSGVINFNLSLPPCAADLAPVGSPNGIVDVDDLLAVISTWGACPQPCPPHCAGDANRNCVTDINDLLFVINEWGTCP